MSEAVREVPEVLMRFDLIGADELKRYVNASYTIVDLRSSQEYRLSHVPGAINLPYDELDYMRFGRNTIYIFYCERGIKSIRVSRYLSERGIRCMAVASSYREIVMENEM